MEDRVSLSEPVDFPISDSLIAERATAEEPLFGASDEELALLHRWSSAVGPIPREDAPSIFVLFVGYPRSGHSLVGSLLDAHPEIAIAHELDVMRFMFGGFGRNKILTLLRENATRLARVGRRWGPYDYRVSGQWQGRTRRLRVIGDKKGGATTTRIAANPASLDRLIDHIALPVRAIHVVRHPLDNVASIARRHYPDAVDPTAMAIRRFSGLARANAAIVGRLGDRIITVRLEDLIAAPAPTMQRLASFVGVTAGNDWLAAAGAIVKAPARRSRDRTDWLDEHRADIGALIQAIDFLRGYTLDD